MDVVVFTYGTLRSEKVLRVVLGRVPERVKAELKGYSRHPIRGQCFPAVAPSKDGSVDGYVLFSLTAPELIALDAFEDPAYERSMLSITLTDGRTMEARVWARTNDNVADLELEIDWDFENFVRVHEKRYVQRCSLWAQHYYDSLNQE